MNSSEPHANENVPLVERALPQFTLSLMLKITAVCAVIMFAFRAGALENLFWAKCVSVVIATAVVCFICYAGRFCVASLFASLTGAIIEPFETARQRTQSPPQASPICSDAHSEKTS